MVGWSCGREVLRSGGSPSATDGAETMLHPRAGARQTRFPSGGGWCRIRDQNRGRRVRTPPHERLRIRQGLRPPLPRRRPRHRPPQDGRRRPPPGRDRDRRAARPPHGHRRPLRRLLPLGHRLRGDVGPPRARGVAVPLRARQLLRGRRARRLHRPRVHPARDPRLVLAPPGRVRAAAPLVGGAHARRRGQVARRPPGVGLSEAQPPPRGLSRALPPRRRALLLRRPRLRHGRHPARAARHVPTRRWPAAASR